jgi:hypothetical protein
VNAGRNSTLDKNVIRGERDNVHGARSNGRGNSPRAGGMGAFARMRRSQKRERMGLLRRI